jgi:hypothetical protein
MVASAMIPVPGVSRLELGLEVEEIGREEEEEAGAGHRAEAG